LTLLFRFIASLCALRGSLRALASHGEAAAPLPGALGVADVPRDEPAVGKQCLLPGGFVSRLEDIPE